MSTFLETVSSEYNRMRARSFASDGYEGVTHAGIALVSLDTGAVLLAQRSMDKTDAPDVAETWEFPGGGLDPGEEPYAGAVREFSEEIGLSIPEDAMVMDGWRSDDGVYQGFVVTTAPQRDLTDWVPTEETQALGWFTREMIAENENLRPEVRDGTDWDLIFGVSGNEDDTVDDEPDYSDADFGLDAPIPIHGVLAPEEAETGDGRGFAAGSMTSRPNRLPFSWQKTSTSGHDQSVVTGSVDRMMRSDGMIHWEGLLMPCEEADDFANMLAFFGQFGVSVDGDKGSLDAERTDASGVMWFDAVRAAGLTAVHIPAFHEAYVAFGPHPTMPSPDDTLTASLHASGDLVEFGRGPGWATDPKATNRIHDYWTKKGEPGYAKVGWGTPGDFTRAKKLIGAKIAEHSPDKVRFLNQIIAQWHFDALGYWPGDLGKPGNAPDTAENRRRAATHAALADNPDLEPVEESDEDGEMTTEWEAVLVSSVTKERVLPPADYFSFHPDSGALVIEEPDANGLRRTYGYAGEWGVCHIGYEGRCVDVPADPTGSSYPEFHLGRTKTTEGYINTGLVTFAKAHRDADQILTDTAVQAHFDDLRSAWAAVVIGENERGIWFSGVVLPTVEDKWITTIEASGQVSGEWKYGALRTLLTVNVPGFPVMRSSAAYDDQGNVIALVASALSEPYKVVEPPDDAVCAKKTCSDAGTWGVWESPDFATLYCENHYAEAASAAEHTCKDDEPTPAMRMAALRQADAEARFEDMKKEFA